MEGVECPYGANCVYPHHKHGGKARAEAYAAKQAVKSGDEGGGTAKPKPKTKKKAKATVAMALDKPTDEGGATASTAIAAPAVQDTKK